MRVCTAVSSPVTTSSPAPAWGGGNDRVEGPYAAG